MKVPIGIWDFPAYHKKVRFRFPKFEKRVRFASYELDYTIAGIRSSAGCSAADVLKAERRAIHETGGDRNRNRKGSPCQPALVAVSGGSRSKRDAGLFDTAPSPEHGGRETAAFARGSGLSKRRDCCRERGHPQPARSRVRETHGPHLKPSRPEF